MSSRETSHVIRIDTDVEKALLRRSKPHESWNQTLRRVLGLKPTAKIKKRRSDNGT